MKLRFEASAVRNLNSNKKMINAASLKVTGKTNHPDYHIKKHIEKQDMMAKYGQLYFVYPTRHQRLETFTSAEQNDLWKLFFIIQAYKSYVT